MNLCEQAFYYRALLDMKLIERRAVIEWADKLILMTSAPVEIIDIALATNVTSDRFDQLLRAVSGTCDTGAVARCVLARIGPVLKQRSLGEAVKLLFSFSRLTSLPAESWTSLHSIDYAYDELKDYGFGTEAEIRREIDAFVSKFAS